MYVMSASDYPRPPATCEFLTISLKTQVEMQVGILYFGDEKERRQPDFRLARHTIDMLAMLQDKTKGNLSMEEQRLIENSLTELRFRFVQTLEQAKKDSPTDVSAETKSTSEPSPTEPEETKEGQPAG